MGFSTQSLLFDGSTQYGTAGDVLGFEYNQAFSISFWFKSTDTGTRHIVSKTDGSSGWLLTLAVGQVRWKLASSSGGSSCGIITTPTYNDGAWHHVVATYSASTPGSVADMAIYIDGSLATTTTESDPLGSNTIANSASFNVSGRTDGSALFPGSVDEVAVYNKALSPAEVMWIRNGGNPQDLKGVGAPTGLVSWWQCGENVVGALMPDQQGSNDITLVNSPTAQSDVPLVPGLEVQPIVAGAEIAIDVYGMVFGLPFPDEGVVYYRMRGIDQTCPAIQQPAYVYWTVQDEPDWLAALLNPSDLPCGSTPSTDVVDIQISGQWVEGQ
jgi:hypothetical protein